MVIFEATYTVTKIILQLDYYLFSYFSTSTRRVEEDGVILNGFELPKGTGIQFDINAVHNNPKYWPDPETFNMDRWVIIAIQYKKIIQCDCLKLMLKCKLGVRIFSPM